MPRLLDLSTVVDRPTVAIDGKAYELRTPDDLSLIEWERLFHYGKQLDKLQRGEELTEQQAQETELAIERVFDLAFVDLPDDVRSRLTFKHKLAICEAFTGLLPGSTRQLARAVAPAPSGRTSGSPSAASPEPTAAIRSDT